MLGRRTAAVVAAVSAVLSTAAGARAAGPVNTGLGIKLLDAPSSLVNDPRAHSYIVDSLKPGATIVRHVSISNDTGRRAHILLYVASAQIEQGRFTIGARGTTNELTTWANLTPAVVDLAQGTSARATLTVRVPADAADGERYAAIVADLPPSGSGSGIQVESRVGVRMYLQVRGANAAPPNFTIDTLTAERDSSGRPVVQAQVHNVGGRAVDLSGSLKLTNGPGGLSAGPFAAELGTTLAPGQTEPVTVKLDKALPAGPWHARIELQSGLLRRAAEATITFPSSPGSVAAPVAAKSVPLTRNRHLLVPLAIGLILGLVVGLVLFLFWRRRRRRGQADEANRPNGGAPEVPGQRVVSDERVRR